MQEERGETLADSLVRLDAELQSFKANVLKAAGKFLSPIFKLFIK